MNIILIGPPACGKGTQSKLLEEEFDLAHISTGDLLREIKSQQSDLALEIKSFVDNGHFVPDEIVIQLVKDKLNETKSHQGVLFDGFPRTVFQAKKLEEMLKIDYIFEIELSKQTLVERITDRAVCKNCGKGVILSKLKEKKCDSCGGEVAKRDDDTAEIAKTRYQDYIQKTYPIVEYFKGHRGYHKIDGEQSIEAVFDQICKVIKRDYDLSENKKRN